MELIFLILIGLAAGLIGGMGMGGGTLLIPMLTILFGIEQHTAQAINLTAFIPMSIVAIIIHMKNKLIDFKKAIYVIIPSCFTAVLGSIIAKNLEGKILQKLFGAFLVALAIFQIVYTVIERKKTAK